MSEAKSILTASQLSKVNIQDEILLSQKLLSFADDTKALKKLVQGDVIISRSGNVRLVLKLESLAGLDQRALFLTRSRNNELGLEKALISKIDPARLVGRVRRVAGNPLIRFSDVAQNLAHHPDVIHNTAVLLACGPLGSKMYSELIDNAAPIITKVQVGLTVSNRKISVVGATDLIPEIMLPIGLHFSSKGLPSIDYLEQVTFYENISGELKERFMLACVLANTIANARNLSGLYLALQGAASDKMVN